jgi:parallel beta-helix repeat protein
VSDRNAIKNNNANDNWHGFIIKYSFRNTITGNRIQRNKMDGINLKHSNDNLMWDNGSRGTPYSGLNCTDADVNGICDSKHNVTGGSNVERYPLASWGQAQ